jgi:hypothetical protein
MTRAVDEKSLEQMEALLAHSARGVHVLFDNDSIARVLRNVRDDRDFSDLHKMKLVQDMMTELVAKKSFFEKMAYLRTLKGDSYDMLVRAYFHIVENTVRANHDLQH